MTSPVTSLTMASLWGELSPTTSSTGQLGGQRSGVAGGSRGSRGVTGVTWGQGSGVTHRRLLAPLRCRPRSPWLQGGCPSSS